MKGKKIPETSLDAYFKGDIKILQFMGMFSMNAVMEQKKPKMCYREWLMCIAGLGHISMGLMGDIYNGIDAAKADWVESITVFAAIVCSAFTLFKVSK
uniref:Uncharacterized protein n=1 Tax=Bracon brevicornis TaxID=1563983 RepID=A0A6V7LR05_9HYME